MLSIPVTDMAKSKEFYETYLGLSVTKDYRQDAQNWWVSLALPNGDVTITLSTYPGMKPGNASIYLTASDIAASHKALVDNGVDAGEVRDDLYGPGSGVKFIELADPDGNKVMLVQE